MVRIIADAMYGKLGKFLRLLGFDTELADVTWTDDRIFEKALAEDRILITRDQPFFDRAKKILQNRQLDPKHILYIPSTDLITQIALTFIHLKIDPVNYLWEPGHPLPFNTRCTICNNPVKRVPKEEISAKIPPKTYEHYKDFWCCENEKCQKIYWIGRHFDDIRNQLVEVKEKMEKIEQK